MSRPSELFITAERERIDGACPECGREELAGYRVIGEQGWEEVVKCQHCLHSVRRERWHRLGPVTLLAETL
jgi:uncharacterized Zn finger protein